MKPAGRYLRSPRSIASSQTEVGRPTPASERTNEIRFSVITRRISWLIGVARLNVVSTSESGRAYVEIEIQREEVLVPFENGDDDDDADDAIPFS